MKKLAIIGANEYQLPLVEKAKEMGIETHCFAWDKEGDTECRGIADYYHPISILEKEQILEKCKEIKIDGVASIMVDYAVPTVAYIAQNMGLPGNRYEDALITTNKYLLRQVFYRHGVKSPRFATVRESVDLSGFHYPLIVKPTDRSDSVGVIKVEREKDLKDAIQKAINDSYCKEAIIEELITGSEVSVDSISWNGKHYLLAIKDKDISKSIDFLLLAKHYPSLLSEEIQNKIKDETIKALDAINFKYGAANTQFKINDAGDVFSIEINPRMPGDHAWMTIPLHNGYDYLKGVIDVALDQFEEPVFTDNKFSGMYYLYENTEWARQIIDHKNGDPDIVKMALFNEEEKYKGRIGYFVYQSDKKRRWGE